MGVSGRYGNQRGMVRIIAGDWRGRKLPVADLPGLRPTGDRARETLFNWLQGHIHGARCADLFAGTGALGFEAASRGAAGVVLVERSRAAAQALRESASLLKAKNVSVEEGDAIRWLAGQPSNSLDLVFIDPPFDSQLAVEALDALQENACLAAGGLVYLESARGGLATPGAAWAVVREKVIGEVRMQLLEQV